MFYSRWKIALYAVSILIGLSLAVPNLIPHQQLDALPDWLPKQQVALGLDLRGGSHLLLEVDSAALVRSRVETLADVVAQALKEVGLQGSEVTIADAAVVSTIRDTGRMDEALKAIRQLIAPLPGAMLGAGSPDIQVTAASGNIRVKPTDAATAAWI
jgi:SecD/SecF fusion protein